MLWAPLAHKVPGWVAGWLAANVDRTSLSGAWLLAGWLAGWRTLQPKKPQEVQTMEICRGTYLAARTQEVPCLTYLHTYVHTYIHM